MPGDALQCDDGRPHGPEGNGRRIRDERQANAWSGRESESISSAPVIATGVPNPGAPSKNAPSGKAMSTSCTRRSALTVAMLACMWSKAPCSFVTDRGTGCETIQPIRQEAMAAPAAHCGERGDGGMPSTDTAIARATTRPPARDVRLDAPRRNAAEQDDDWQRGDERRRERVAEWVVICDQCMGPHCTSRGAALPVFVPALIICRPEQSEGLLLLFVEPIGALLRVPSWTALHSRRPSLTRRKSPHRRSNGAQLFARRACSRARVHPPRLRITEEPPHNAGHLRLEDYAMLNRRSKRADTRVAFNGT